MTYNFDPELWYETRSALLEARFERGEIDEQALRKALEELAAEHERIVASLDGTYSIPR